MPKFILLPDQPIQPPNRKIDVSYSDRIGSELRRGWATAKADHMQDILTPEAMQAIEAANNLVGVEKQVVAVEIIVTWGKR